MHFAAIQGYASLKQRLIHMVQTGQVPHAQLFWGPAGSASLPLARAFVAYFHCQHRHATDACGRCPACRKVQKHIHPDVKFVFPTSAPRQRPGKGALGAQGLQHWRTFLQEQPYGLASDWSAHLGSEGKPLIIPKEAARGILQDVSLKAFVGQGRVILIWLPEYFHPAAANALLKVVEEPPRHTLFLLVSEQPAKVLGTLRSRMQLVYVPPCTDEALASLLTQERALSQTQLAQVLPLAGGSLSRARGLLAPGGEDYFARCKEWLRWCYAQDWPHLVAQAGVFQALPRAGQQHWLAYALHLLREAVVAHFGPGGLSKDTVAVQQFAWRLRQTLSQQQLRECIGWLDRAGYYLERHVHPKLLYLHLSLQIGSTFVRHAAAANCSPKDNV